MSASETTILYVITDLNVGGVPLHLHRLGCEMRTRGYRPKVVSLAPPGPVADRLRENGIDVEGLEAKGPWDLRVFGRLARIIQVTTPDIVHALLFHANVAARRAARKVGFPAERVLCEIQTVEVERCWHLWVDRWTHGGCRLTIGNSPSVIEHLASRAGIPRERLRLIRGGIDPATIAEAVAIDRTAMGLPEKCAMVLWVGRFDPVKGLDTLIRAFRTMINGPGASAEVRAAHLVLVGEGPTRHRVARVVGEAGLRDRVHLPGRRSDVPAVLKAADLFVLPSRTEGLPNALLEAMAAACPIVTTNVPGCRDLIESEETGVVVPYGDTVALAGAMRRLLEDRPKACLFGRRAAEEVSSSWHIRRMFDAYAGLYEETLGPAG